MTLHQVNHIVHATREIPLTKGFVAVVDAEDASLVAGYVWRALISKTRETPYAAAHVVEGGRQRTVLMHRLIMATPDDQVVDHRDGDGLNNRRSNMRNCVHQQNMWNRRRQRGSSQYKGVRRQRNRWVAQIVHCNATIYLGTHGLEVEAAHAFDLAARELRGEFAALNFPDRSPALVAEDRLFFQAATGLDLDRIRAKAAAAEARFSRP